MQSKTTWNTEDRKLGSLMLASGCTVLQLPLTPLNQSLLLLWQKTQCDMNPGVLTTSLLTIFWQEGCCSRIVMSWSAPHALLLSVWGQLWSGQSAVHPNTGIRDSQITQGRRDLGMSPSSLLACSMKSEQAVQGHTQSTNTLQDGNCTTLLAGSRLSTAPPSEPKSPRSYQHTCWSKHPGLIFQDTNTLWEMLLSLLKSGWVTSTVLPSSQTCHFITESSLVKHGLPLVNPFQQCQMPSSPPKHSQQQPQWDTDLSVPTTELQEQLSAQDPEFAHSHPEKATCLLPFERNLIPDSGLWSPLCRLPLAVWVSLSPCALVIHPTALQTSSQRQTDALWAWCGTVAATQAQQNLSSPPLLWLYMKKMVKYFIPNLIHLLSVMILVLITGSAYLWHVCHFTPHTSTEHWPTQTGHFTLSFPTLKLLTVLPHTSGFCKLGLFLPWTNLQFLNTVAKNIRWPSELKGKRLLKHFI